MVMRSKLMTMSIGGRWNIASAKAELSRLVRDARDRPQVIENRGRAVAVVLSAEEYERMAGAETSADRWRAVLGLSAEIRAEGGVSLQVPRRRPRRSPFAGARRRAR
jgi:prevent-host-death family protein